MKEKREISYKNLSLQEKKIITCDLFDRYRRGETSPEESEVVESLEKDFIPEKDFTISDELIARLDKEIKDFVFERTIAKTKRQKITSIFFGSAASIALLIVGLILFQKRDDPRSNTPKEFIAESTIGNIKLPDGTHITLNAGTLIRYNDSREVWLQEGEAFFDVRPDAEQPFTVHLDNGLLIRVLGTSFTVQSYSELPFQQVDVLSGKVEVSSLDKQSVELFSDQKVTYRNGELLKGTTSAVKKASWRTETVILENASFDELHLRIRQLYQKEIIFEGVPEDISINIMLSKNVQPEEIATEIATLYTLSYYITNNEIIFQPQ